MKLKFPLSNLEDIKLCSINIHLQLISKGSRRIKPRTPSAPVVFILISE